MSTEWSERPRGTASRMKGPRSISLQLKANCPVSIWVMSRVSLARRARCSVSLMTVRMNSCRVSMGRSGSSSTSSAKPRMAMRGRRKSWATMPTNSLFRRSNSWSWAFTRLSSLWRVMFSTATVAWAAMARSRFRSSSVKGARFARSATRSRPWNSVPAGHGRDHERLQAELAHEVGEEAGVGLGLVREQGPVLAEVPARAGLAVHEVAQAQDLLGGEAVAGGLGHHLPALLVVEQDRPRARRASCSAHWRAMCPKSASSPPGQGEGPGHLVEAEQLLALALEHALLGLGLEQAAHPHLQLHRVGGLADDLVGLRGGVGDVVLVEDDDGQVGAQGLAHACGPPCPRWGRRWTGRPAGGRGRSRGPAGCTRRPLGTTVTRWPVSRSIFASASARSMSSWTRAMCPRGTPPRRLTPCPGRADLSMLVKRATMLRRAARAMGFTR